MGPPIQDLIRDTLFASGQHLAPSPTYTSAKYVPWSEPKSIAHSPRKMENQAGLEEYGAEV
jgi:hypothetical protein